VGEGHGDGLSPRSRAAPAELVELADTVTEMTLIKHHFNAGVPAQRGIED
jgi:cob(I)alamin adenosyltransferase